MSQVLLVHSPSHPVRIERFERGLAGHEVETLELPPGGVDVDAEDALVDALDGHEALFLRPGRVTARVVESAPDLRAIATHSSGYDHIDVAAATRAGVVVTHSPGAPAPGVVEHALCLMVTLLRDLPARAERTARGDWAGARETVPELGRRTVGVVGLGTVGLDVARTVAGLGADVLGYDPYVAGERESRIWPRHDRETVEAAGVELVGLDDLLRRSEVVTLHVPLTEETRGMIGDDELAALGGGYLINLARGGVVDEDALLAAVERGALAGVALDVLEREPPDPDDPLPGHPDVLVTPHIAGVTDGYLDRAAALGAEKIRAVLEGERPDAVVNPEVLDGRS